MPIKLEELRSRLQQPLLEGDFWERLINGDTTEVVTVASAGGSIMVMLLQICLFSCKRYRKWLRNLLERMDGGENAENISPSSPATQRLLPPSNPLPLPPPPPPDTLTQPTLALRWHPNHRRQVSFHPSSRTTDPWIELTRGSTRRDRDSSLPMLSQTISRREVVSDSEM